MTRMLISLALTGALLGGCVTRPEAVPTTLSVNVPTPVAVSCLKPGTRPRLPSTLKEDQPIPPASLTEKVGRLRAKLEQWRAYGKTADALLAICEAVQPLEEVK